MNSEREKEFNELFKAKEIINSEIHKSKNIKNSFSKYGLVNTNWYKDYLHFLKKPSKESNDNIEEKLFKNSRLHPEQDKRDYSFINRGTFTFPSNFVFVTENFVNLISNYIYQYDDYKNYECFKKYLFEISIGGECIIMKNFKTQYTENMYIIIYEENKGNVNNNIDFILMIDDYNEMKKSLSSIIENNIWIYLKNIGLSIEDDEKEIKNDKGEKIGYIYRNGEIKRKEEIKAIQKMKSVNITATQNIIPKFNSILMCFYLSNIFLQELSKFSLDNKNVKTKIFVEYFQNSQIDKIKTIFSKSIKIDNFEDIFDEIFEKLDLELSNKNENKELNGENDQLEAFKEQYKNSSIIKRLFYCPQEIKKYCPYCEKTYYKYKYNKIILLKSIDTEKENFLFEKIFKPEEIEKRERCKLCHRESKCLNYKQFIFFPKILIIVIKEDQIGKLNLTKEIKNDKGISYELYCLIEANTNMVYYKNDYGLWLKFDDNKKEDIESKIPNVLFYKLMNIKNNMVNNNINNQFRNNNNQNLMINNINNMNNMNNNTYYIVKNVINNANNNNKMNNMNNIYNINNLNNMKSNTNNNNNISNMNNKNNINNMNNVGNMNNMNNFVGTNPYQPIINNNNLNKINNKSNANNNNTNKNGNKLIFIEFIYENNKGFININEKQKLNDAIEILNRKYKWIKPIDRKKFYLDENKRIEIKKELEIYSITFENKPLIYIK